MPLLRGTWRRTIRRRCETIRRAAGRFWSEFRRGGGENLETLAEQRFSCVRRLAITYTGTCWRWMAGGWGGEGTSAARLRQAGMLRHYNGEGVPYWVRSEDLDELCESLMGR